MSLILRWSKQFLLSFLVYALFGCGGGGGGGGNDGSTTLSTVDLIGAWTLTEKDGINAASSNTTLVISASSYTYTDPQCTENGSWSLNGATLVTTPSTSACGKTAGSGYSFKVAVTGDQMRLTDNASSSLMVFRKQSSGTKTLATGMVPAAIAVDANRVYVSDFLVYNGNIRSVGLNGGAVTNLASAVDNSVDLAVDSTSLYWVENTVSTFDTGGSVKKVALGGGAAVTLATGTGFPTTLAIDSTDVYFAEFYRGTILKVGINGGPLVTLASGLYRPDYVGVDATSVYWADNTTIGKVAKNGGAITVLASVATAATSLAVDAANVYWTEGATIRKVATGGGVVTDLATGLSNPSNIVVDGTNAYWIEEIAVGNASIRKVSLNGGTPTTLVSALNTPSCLAVDATSVYWGERNNQGAIKKAPK